MSQLRFPWTSHCQVVTSRITSLLEQAHGSVNRALLLNGPALRSPVTALPGIRSSWGLAGAAGAQKQLFAGLPHQPDDRPPGLGNWDNSCYQNSIIQGLASLRCLRRYLQAVASPEVNEARFPGISLPATTALQQILNDLNNPRNNGRPLWTPSSLKSMSSWQQQDAHEYFSKILEQLDKELKEIVVLQESLENPGLELSSAALLDHDPEGQAKSGGSRLVDERLAGEAGPAPRRRPLQNPLEGYLAQRVGCLRCGWSEGLSMIPFICVTLPLGTGWDISLESCLDEYTKLEPIQEVECAKCSLIHSKRQLEAMLPCLQPEDTRFIESAETSLLGDSARQLVTARLDAVNTALAEEDFSEETLAQKCKISRRNRETTTKTRQAVIGRAPKSLAIHINRSVFDEHTGSLSKNYAGVQFPATLDLSAWCLHLGKDDDDDEVSAMDRQILNPARSLLDPLSRGSAQCRSSEDCPVYNLRAVVAHYGRHENGHYMCYRATDSTDGLPRDDTATEGPALDSPRQRWWKLNDEHVTMVAEEEVLDQGGVFMLFYERVDLPMPSRHGTTMSIAASVVEEEQTMAAITAAAEASLDSSPSPAPLNWSSTPPLLPAPDSRIPLTYDILRPSPAPDLPATADLTAAAATPTAASSSPSSTTSDEDSSSSSSNDDGNVCTPAVAAAVVGPPRADYRPPAIIMQPQAPVLHTGSSGAEVDRIPSATHSSVVVMAN
ncbi:MAG: hypothetical protein M1826_004709 [Phylliscum demangeonii]|nr:MAG: hypothetical protein M1826_004709 [Phylliscum demangeonii]